MASDPLVRTEPRGHRQTRAAPPATARGVCPVISSLDLALGPPRPECRNRVKGVAPTDSSTAPPRTSRDNTHRRSARACVSGAMRQCRGERASLLVLVHCGYASGRESGARIYAKAEVVAVADRTRNVDQRAFERLLPSAKSVHVSCVGRASPCFQQRGSRRVALRSLLGLVERYGHSHRRRGYGSLRHHDGPGTRFLRGQQGIVLDA